MFEQAFRNIDDVLRKEAGCTTELDYTEQTSWLLFLKYLEDLEQDKSSEAMLEGKKYTYILDNRYRWESWAAPKDKYGNLDHNKAMTGDDLRDFVNTKLFPYLQAFTQRATGPNTIEYKIGQIFGEIKNKIQSGYNLREIIDRIDELRFRSQAEKHELSHLYEAKIRNMGNAGRNGGEYYTPRPLIRAIVRVLKPRIGKRIYDGAVGSAGFLCEAFDYMAAKPRLTTKEARTLQESTFVGKEKKSLAYVIAIMNMILHGIEAPNIIHTNTLTENLADIQEKDRFNIVMANPPFGGKERKELQQNFPIRTGEMATGTLGRVAQLRTEPPEPTTIDSHVTIVRPRPGIFFQEFFGYMLRDIEDELKESGDGCGGQTELNRTQLAEKFVVRFPRSLSEQQRIVGILDKAFEGIATAKASAQKNVQNARALFESHLQSIFTKRGKGSVERRLGDVVTRLTNGYVGPTRDIYRESGVPYLLARHVKDNPLMFDGKTFISNQFNLKLKKSILKAGDVLLVQSGHIGHSAVVTEDHEGHNCHAMIVITPVKDTIAGPFLSLFFNSQGMRQKFDEIRSGSTVPHLTCREVKELSVALPDLTTQQHFVDHSRELDTEIQRLVSLYDRKVAALEALKKSLLHQAFTGQL